MKFDWDAANLAHIARHSISPDEAEEVLRASPYDLGVQFRNGEERTVHLGVTGAGRVLIVIVTIRKGWLRVVTAHPADRTARAFYAAKKEEGDEDSG